MENDQMKYKVVESMYKFHSNFCITATICGSYRYEKEMMDCYRELTDKGFMTFLPAIGCTGHDHPYYRELHFAKIHRSNVIVVVGEHVGEHTFEEIYEARRIGVLVARYIPKSGGGADIYLDPCIGIDDSEGE